MLDWARFDFGGADYGSRRSFTAWRIVTAYFLAAIAYGLATLVL
jgi:hypothetical protein